MAVFQPISGIPQFLADGTQSGTAPTGYAPGTIVQLLGEQLASPPPQPAEQFIAAPVAPNVFQPLMDQSFMDGGSFDLGDDPMGAENAVGTGNSIGSDVGGLVQSLGGLVGGISPGKAAASLIGLQLGIPGLALGADALGVFDSPETNVLGQTQQAAFGNKSIDSFGNPVGSPENIASVASFNPDTGQFTDARGEPMSSAPNPDVSPDDFSADADQAQAADQTGLTGDTYGETTASDNGDGMGKVICTELHRQGKLDDATMAADKKFGENVAQNDPHTMIGYHCWALPIVRQMRKSKIITFIVSLLALPWAREMYFRQTGNGRGSYRGRVLMAFGIPVCRFMGRRRSRGWVPPFRD